MNIGLRFDAKWLFVRTQLRVSTQLGYVEIDRLEALIDNVIYGFDAQVVRCELDFN